jgi:hypothetical protein
MNDNCKSLIQEAKEWLNNNNPATVHNDIRETSNLVQKLISALQERDLYDQRIAELEEENKELKIIISFF